MKRLLYLALAGATLLPGCKKDEPDAEPTGVLPSNAVLVLNEGNYTYGNASITLYDPATEEVTEGLFTANTNRPLGDVAQSVSLVNDTAYIVVNNSGKIEVLDLTTMTEVATIVGLTSPRYLLPLGDGRAYVSDIYSNTVHIVDLSSFSVTGSIALSVWTEQMVLAGNKAYICNYDSLRVEVVDITTDTKIKHIDLNAPASSIAMDGTGNIWVLAEKDLNGNTALLARIDTSSVDLNGSMAFDADASPSDLTMSPNGTSFYFLMDGVRMFNTNSMPTSAADMPVLIPDNGRTLYALGINKTNDRIYVADALDYNQKGTVLIYDASSYLETASFKAGIIPGAFLFY